MKILIACECSGRVRDAFTRLGAFKKDNDLARYVCGIRKRKMEEAS